MTKAETVSGHAPKAQTAEIDTNKGKTIISGLLHQRDLSQEKRRNLGIQMEIQTIFESMNKVKKRVIVMIPTNLAVDMMKRIP